MKFNFDHAGVWRLAGPLIVSNISVAVLGMVDIAVVGHLADPWYLGAVAVGAVIFDFLYWGTGFLRMGTTGVVAQIHGRGDPHEMRSALLQAGTLALAIAALFLLLQLPIANLGLTLIGGSENVRHYARIYFEWAIWGAPAVLSGMAITGWLLGMQNAGATLAMAVITNAVNVVLDFYFVFGLDMDVRGVALASVLAQYAGTGVGLMLVRRELSLHPGEWRRTLILDGRRFRSTLALKRNIFIRTLCIIFAFAFFTRQGAMQGELILAANAILINFLLLTSLGLDGFANAAEAMVGKAIGAGERGSFLSAVQSAGFWSLIIAVGFTLFFALFGGPLVNLMTDLEGVRAVAHRYLPWVVVLPLIGVWCYLLDGIFIGATRGREMRDTLLVSTFLVFIPAWYALRFLGNDGLWLAMLMFFAARGVTLGWVFYRIEHTGGFVPRGS